MLDDLGHVRHAAADQASTDGLTDVAHYHLGWAGALQDVLDRLEQALR